MQNGPTWLMWLENHTNFALDKHWVNAKTIPSLAEPLGNHKVSTPRKSTSLFSSPVCCPHLASHFLTSGNILNHSTKAQATILRTATSLSAPGLIKANSVQSLSRVWVFSRQVQFSSVTKSCPTPDDPRDCSTLGFPVLQYLLEFAHKAPYQCIYTFLNHWTCAKLCFHCY